MTYKIHAKRFRSDISYKDKWREGNLSHKILIVADSINLVPLYMVQMDLCIMGKINQEYSH